MLKYMYEVIEMRSRKYIITSIVFNSLIIALELFALSEVFFRYLPGTEAFKWYYSLTYYTNLSNILLLIASTIMLVVDIRELHGIKSHPALHIVKFIAVVVTAVTFTTIWIMIPFAGDIKYGIAVRGNMWLLLHTLCPILGFVSYIFLDTTKKIFKVDVIFPLLFTLFYTIMVELLFINDLRVPYAADMEDFTLKGWLILVLCIFESLLTVGIAFGVRYLKLKYYQIRKEENE
ncbi:MAG: hypothetical protein K6G48_01415 [Acholeplasmatales bacterium]|nr:hypothetical protein [Acholeplasmatales bacterium]